MPHRAPIDAHALIPLELAAEAVRKEVYRDRRPGLGREELLDSIATTISVVATIYEYDPDGGSPARPLTRVELNGGMFKGGAKELRFVDGRPARWFLAVSAADINDTIEALKGAQR